MENDNAIKFRRQQAEAVSGPLMLYLRQSGLYDGLLKNKLSELWDEFSGVKEYTIGKYLKEDTLYVTISSSALRNKLHCQLPSILRKINDALCCDQLYAGSSISKIILR